MTSLCIYHGDIFYAHRAWFEHPESPERLHRVVSGLKTYGLWERARVFEPIEAERELALLIHDEAYVAEVEAGSRRGRYLLDPDTYVNEYTFKAALSVLGSVRDAVEKTVNGECKVAVVLGRPPGHHAGRSGAALGAPTLGFCIFNGSALASKLLVDRGYTVLHVDFDLHYGNGTQDILWNEARAVHADLHQDPSTIYPGTGWPWQTGGGEAEGTKLNIVLPPGAGDDAFRESIEVLLRIVEEKGWRFDYLVFSAGFDAYDGDGLGMLHATANTYFFVGRHLLEELKPKGVVVVWEGGYSVGLERGFPAFISALLGLENPVKDMPTKSPKTVIEELEENLRSLCKSIGLDESTCRVRG